MKIIGVLLALVLVFLLGDCTTAPSQKADPQKGTDEYRIAIEGELPFDYLKPERKKEAEALGYKPGDKVRVYKPPDGEIRILPKK